MKNSSISSLPLHWPLIRSCMGISLKICVIHDMTSINVNICSEKGNIDIFIKGGVQGKFFWRIRFELWAPQVPLIIAETFGEVLGPRRPTVSEPRPAQKLGVK